MDDSKTQILPALYPLHLYQHTTYHSSNSRCSFVSMHYMMFQNSVRLLATLPLSLAWSRQVQFRKDNKLKIPITRIPYLILTLI